MTISPTWLPDGQSLLYRTQTYGLDGNPGASTLWTVDRSGLRVGRDGAEAYSAHVTPARAPLPGAAGGAPSGFTAIEPRRVLDTRTSRTPVGPGGTLDPGGTVEVQVTGQPCRSACVELPASVPADATAVALTVTAVQASASTDVRVYPAGGPPPDASNLNLTAGQTVANAVLVPVGRDGTVTLANSAGRVHLLVDVAGYFRADGGDGLAATEPRRILDTRAGLGAPQARLGPAATLDLQVTGTLPDADGGTVSVPATATAVVLNLTATGASASTDVRAYPTPDGDRVPEVSNLNLRAGQTAASLVTVAVGSGGRVRLRNAGGQVHLVADLAGWYGPGAPARFVPARPLRVLDTRTGLGAASLPTGPGEAVQLTLGGRRGVPADATAVALNLTGTGVSGSTDVRAYPAGAAQPPTFSNLNLTAGATRANLAVVPLSDGALRLRNAAGTVSLVADLAGWFVPSPAG